MPPDDLPQAEVDGIVELLSQKYISHGDIYYGRPYIMNKGFCWEDNLRDRFAVTQYPRLGVKIEFGKNALPISAAVSNLAQHPHQHQERRGKEGESRGDESRNKVRNAQQTSPLKKTPGQKFAVNVVSL